MNRCTIHVPEGRFMQVIEHHFTCPYCWETISMLVDPSVREQTYVEDCEVCCRPIRVHVETRGHDLVRFDADRMQQNAGGSPTVCHGSQSRKRRNRRCA